MAPFSLLWDFSIALVLSSWICRTSRAKSMMECGARAGGSLQFPSCRTYPSERSCCICALREVSCHEGARCRRAGRPSPCGEPHQGRSAYGNPSSRSPQQKAKSTATLGCGKWPHPVLPGTAYRLGDCGRAVLVPWAFPALLSAQMWSLMYNDRTGIISYFLQQMHILAPGSTLLQTNSGIMTAAIIADVWKTTPFMALLLLAGLQVIPPELYEASTVDGATGFQQFWTITLPMLNGPLTVALLFRTLASLGVFELFYILGGNQVQSMASYSYNYMFTRSTFDFPPGVAAAVVLFVIVIVQITYRFSAMMIVLKGYVKLTSTPPSDQREAKQVQKRKEF